MNKRILVILTASSLVLAPVGFVFAQTEPGANEAQAAGPTRPGDAAPPAAFGRGYGFPRGHGFGVFGSGLPFGHLALGTTVDLTFYDGDPTADGRSVQTLSFTYGTDSEAAFAEAFAAARAGATYLTAEVGEQRRTLELNTADADAGNGTDNGADDGFRYGFGRGGLPLGGLNDGSSVTATFYDGDPKGNGQSLQTLTFTYGESSEAGFAADFAEAAQAAAFVVVTTSPQSYTVPLTASPFGFEGFGRDGDGRGGFGRGGFR